MKKTWEKVWHKELEWDKEDIARSMIFHRILENIKEYFRKENNSERKLESVELGAGVGLCSYFLNEKGFKTTLVDNSINAKKMAAIWWKGKKYTYVLEDLFKYKKRKFDVTLSFGLCEHFSGKQRKAVLTKHLALLKKRGIIVISAPYKNGIFYQLSKFISKILGLWNFGQEIAFTKKEFREFAKKNNLGYKFIMGGFYSSFYDLVVRKPLKICGLKIKRRGDNSTSFLDNFFGSGIVFIGMKK